ncbi:MAG TPA: hypothetical protein VG755_14505 [Nannocystaceae bacterium]|nr:hypothetical protein [Nannocystaceae bacterium]
MFDPDSRYAKSPTKAATTADGRTIVIVTRRFVPSPPTRALTQLVVAPDDRLDLMATRALGDPGQWWQVADANAVLDPEQLELEPGSRVDIAPPRF